VLHLSAAVQSPAFRGPRCAFFATPSLSAVFPCRAPLHNMYPCLRDEAGNFCCVPFPCVAFDLNAEPLQSVILFPSGTPVARAGSFAQASPTSYMRHCMSSCARVVGSRSADFHHSRQFEIHVGEPRLRGKRPVSRCKCQVRREFPEKYFVARLFNCSI
jgi:hypothetical protein